MNSYKEVKKRVMAVILALLMIVTTYQGDMTVLAAGTYSQVGETGGKTIPSGGELAQIFTAESSSYDELTTASLKLDVLPNQQINYTVSVYQNLTDSSNPASGVLSYTSEEQSYTGNSQGEEGKILTYQFPEGTASFSDGETYAVIFSFVSTSDIQFYEGNVDTNGFRRASKATPSWENLGNVITSETKRATAYHETKIVGTDADEDGVIAGSTHDVGILVGQTLDVTAIFEPAYLRKIDSWIRTEGNAVQLSAGDQCNQLKLTGIAPGTDTIRLSYNSIPYDINVHVYSYEVFAGNDSLVYNTLEHQPALREMDGTETGGLIPNYSSLIGYMDNINAGTATITYTSPFKTIPQQTFTFEIRKCTITQQMVDEASFTIDRKTNVITAATMGDYSLNKDFTAAATLTSIVNGKYNYTITVTGIDNCTGAVNRSYSVDVGASGENIDINDMVSEVTLSKTKYTFDGDACEPEVTFYGLDGQEMANFADNCDITYKDNVNSGTAVVTITGKNGAGYTGTITKTYTIAKCNLNPNTKIKVTMDKEAYEYTGSAVKPVPVVILTTAAGTEYTLSENDDYSLSYTNNTEISTGNAVVKITGKGNFKGSISKTFDIIGDLQKDSIVMIGDVTTDYEEGYQSSYEELYTGGEIIPDIEVYMGSNYLNRGVDYSLTFEDNTNAGTATAIITGMGAYADKELRVTFQINPIRMTAPLQITADGKVYTGAAITLEPSEYSLAGLTEDTDYTISYKNNVNAGTASIVATGINNYTGTITGTYRISSRLITDEDISVGTIPDQTYTGNAVTPAVQLFYKDSLMPTSSYSVSYTDNVKIGIATATITGTGNLTGSVVKTFVIKAKTMEGLDIYVGGQRAVRNEAGTLVSPYETSYTGTERKPDIKVMDGSTTLTAFRDYTLGYARNINSGQGILYLTGAGAYQGSMVMVEFTITPKDIASSDITVAYNGSNYKEGEYTLPYLAITDTGAAFGKQSLGLGTDYTVSGTEECKTSGEGKTATICGRGNYTGTTTVEYAVGSNIADASKTSVSLYNPYNSSQVYTRQANDMYYVTYLGQGAAPKVGLTYRDGNNTNGLIAQQDYHVTYKTLTAENGNDIYTAANDNTIEVTITGQGEYYGTLTLHYLIMEAAFTTADAFHIEDNNKADFSFDYDGSEKSVNLSITYLLSNTNKMSLREGTDYTISPSTIGPETGTTMVTLTGMGNFQGVMSVEYTIAPKNVGDTNRFTVAEIPVQEYTTNEITPGFVMTDNKTGKPLVLGEDITVDYDDNVNVGTGRIVVTGINNYKGTRNIPFTIVARSVEDAKVVVRPIADQIYTGNPLTPAFQMYYGNTPLTAGTDYDYSYTDNTAPGKGVITITGKGTYTGETTVNFNIIGDLSNTELFSINGVEPVYYLINNTLNFNNDTVTVKYANNTASLADSNYIIRQENCNVPGTGRITFVGQNYCTGARSISVKVIGSLSEAVISNVKDAYDYTGSPITPTPRVTLGGNVLVKDRDYIVSYGENQQAGIQGGHVSIEPAADSNYTSSNTKTFDIVYNLDDAVVTGVAANYKYTGAPVTPSITKIMVNGKELSSSYVTVEYGENTQAGTGTVTITPNISYVTGSKVISFHIDAISLMDATVALEGQTGSFATPYTGDSVCPQVTVTTSQGRLLTRDQDYTVTYSNNVNVGTANVRVLGTGNYTGAVDRTFTVATKDISASDVEAHVASAGYAGGRPVTPQMTLTYNGRTLKPGEDYTFAITNNTNVSSAALVTFTGAGNFSGNKLVNFEVTQTDLSQGTIVVDSTSSDYTGQAASVHIQVKCPLGDGTYYTLEEGKDYDITYGTAIEDMIEADVYQIQITGKHNFINALNTTYTIHPKSVTSSDIEVKVADMDYTGEAVLPSVQVKDTTRNVVLTEGSEYSLTYSNNTTAASADQELAPTVTVTGMGNYKDAVNKTFHIGEGIEQAVVRLDADTYIYDGGEHRPEATLTYNGRTLLEGIDYTTAYQEDVVNAGGKTVTIQGMGQFYGTVTANYEIQKKIANPAKIRLTLDLPTNENDVYHTIYNGSAAKPEVTVYDDEISSTVPLRAQDYVVTYRNNQMAGSAQSPAYAVVSLRGNYDVGADTYRMGFIIEEKDITDSFAVTLDAYRYAYTGEQIIPAITVTSNDESRRILSPATDYDVTITDNVNAGRATVSITGKGNYSGTVTTNFAIYASLTGAQVTIQNQFYTGEAVYAPVDVICGGNHLIQGEDYTVAYYSNDDYTTSGYVIITPLSSYYSDSAMAAYQIQFTADLLMLGNYVDTYTYTGKAIMPDFTITAPDGSSIPYDQAMVSYVDDQGTGDCTNIGHVTATIPVMVGDNIITLTAEYTIIPKNINTCQIIQLENNTYTGASLTPPVIVKQDGKELEQNTAYTVVYGNNTNPGVADAVVTGIGNYTGTKTLHYNIVSPAMINLKATPASDTAITVSWSKNQHASGYQVYSEDCSTMYGSTPGNAYTVTGLQSGREYTFKVRSYVIVNGVTTYGDFRTISSLTNVASTSITVKSIARGRATINWSVDANVAGYEIYRSTSANGTYSKIAVMPKSAGGYTDSSLKSGSTYYYKVRAYKPVNGTYMYGAYSPGVAITVK